MWFFQRAASVRHRFNAGQRPQGDWARACLPEALVGTGLLSDEVRAFARAARRAESGGRSVSLQLEIDEDPIGDRPGIRVHGAVETGGYWGARRRRWPLGSVPSALAAQIARDYMAAGIPVAAELVSLDEHHAAEPIVAVAFLVPPSHAPAAAPTLSPALGRPRLSVVR